MARILVVDDDEAVRSGLRRVLELMGHEVVEAVDGRGAVRSAAEGDLDLVVTDVNMPEMDGIELIMSFAERHPSLPIIAISGGGKMPKELLLNSAGLLGAVTTLAKPFELPDFQAEVTRALATHTSVGDSTSR